MRPTIATLAICAMVLGLFSESAAATTPREKALARQVTVLKSQVKKLKTANRVLLEERNEARGKLSTAQQGALQAISTMPRLQLFEGVLPIVYTVFQAAEQQDKVARVFRLCSSSEVHEFSTDGKLSSKSYIFSWTGYDDPTCA
jgi:hypothetical protein